MMNENHDVQSFDQNGFTLVEMLIALVVTSIVAAALFTTYQLLQKQGLAQEQVTEMQQNIRVGLNILAQEARYAGYDPNGNDYSIENATQTTFEFSYDNDDGGEVTRLFELYTPTDGDGNDTTSVRITDGAAAIANNIEKLEFEYFNADNDNLGEPGTGANKDNIYTIAIHILARADNEDTGFTNTETYTMPSNDYTFNDHFRRRLMTTRVKLRNMGLNDE